MTPLDPLPGEFFLPQAGVPSSLLPYVNGGQLGRNVAPIVNARSPVMETERFERRLMFLYHEASGNGAANVAITFNPAPPFPSFRVNELWVRNNSGAADFAMLFNAWKQDGSGVGAKTKAYCFVNSSGDWVPLVTRDPTFGNPGASRETLYFNSGPTEFYRNIPPIRDDSDAGNREHFTVETEAAYTAAVTLPMYAEIEFIPDLAQALNGSALVTSTP